ncbi:hypothetical protein AX15_005361 [Amanita polypyramis BW_CC]|nr:hypothetical protein AX15_005361 [Amanita polypyramis BW_CC]
MPVKSNSNVEFMQAWAQAVRVDGAVIVLHLGNHELVCLRHRRSQTLYVSKLIVPSSCSDPGYGKLHVGIYIAAIQDAMDRRQQRSESKPPGDGGHLISGGKDQHDQDHDCGSGSGRGHRRVRRKGGHSGRFRGSAGRKGQGFLEASVRGRRSTNFNGPDAIELALIKIH